MMETLIQQLENWSGQEKTVDVKVINEDHVAALCTPLMNRVHQTTRRRLT